MADRLLPPVRAALRALAATIVPGAGSLDEAGWAEVEAIMEDALAQRPPRVRRQFVAFVRLLRFLPVLRYGRPFTALDAGRRTRFLAAIERAPVLLLRRGFWGLRTLVLMGCYGRPGAAAEIGYRAHPRGWEAPR